jgi:hypothetical protein
MTDRQFSVPMPDGSRAMLDCFGCAEFEIETSKGVARFEWSNRFGPLPISKSGKPRDLSHRHQIWRAVSLWRLQGSRLEGIRAIWHEPKKPVLQHLGGRHYRVIEDGEPGHDW